MPARLVPIDGGPDIPLDRAVVVVGRHPQCTVRLDSLRISRQHCCMTQDNGELVVRDLGSTNGIRVNGVRLEEGRLKPGDELWIAHIRYRLESEHMQEATMADVSSAKEPNKPPLPDAVAPLELPAEIEGPLAAAFRGILPAGVADRCRIQVIVQMRNDADAAEKHDACRPDSSP